MIVTPDAPLLVASSLLLFALAKVLQTAVACVAGVGAAVARCCQIHRAVLRSGDPDLAVAVPKLRHWLISPWLIRGSSRWFCLRRSFLERRPPLGVLHQADGRRDRDFRRFHRRADPDADRVRDALVWMLGAMGLYAIYSARRRAAGARARQYDVLVIVAYFVWHSLHAASRPTGLRGLSGL